MPQHKQPDTLEALALKVISLYVRNVGLQLTASVCTMVPGTVVPDENVSTIKLKVLQPDEDYKKVELDISCFADFLYGSLPRVLVGKMTKHILDGIARATDRTVCTLDGFKSTGDSKCRDVFKKMIVEGTSPYLTCLDLKSEPFLIRKVLCENLYRLLKLEVLIVKICDGWENTNQMFLRDLPLLQNLVSFNMECDCTDEIVNVLGEHCRNLKCLDVTGAVGITDHSVENILKMKNLYQLHLSGTAMTEIGFLKLLNGLINEKQKFENENADQSSGDGPSKIGSSPMKIIGCSFVRNLLLKTLVEHFPCLTHISLCTLQCDLSILKDLKYLREVKLTGGNFVRDNLKGLLEEKGTSLQLLDLLLFQDVDLVLISRCCDELKVLKLRSCTFQATVPVASNKYSVAPFQKLEELTFYVQCPLQYVQFLLRSCRNIKIITIGLIRAIDDKFVASTLSTNSMKQLEDFKIYFSGHLTLHTARLLMTHCPRLSVIGGLETWDGVSQQELVHFREELRNNNLVLRVVIR